MKDIIKSLSPIEIKVLPLLGKPIVEIIEKTGLDKTTVLRALKFLENKGLVKSEITRQTIIRPGINGIFYRKNTLPERRLLTIFEQKKQMPLSNAKELSKLSDNEFKASLGVLKRKAFLEIKNGKIILTATKNDLTKKLLEEQLLETLPLEKAKLKPEQLLALKNLSSRKNIIEIIQKKKLSFYITELGKNLIGKEIKTDLLEEVTPNMIKLGTKGKQFRHYDIQANVPAISGGKKHFVNQSIEYGKKIWLELGFKEMTGNLIETSFWNFDSLFTPQDHPAREMQDTFFIKNLEGKLPTQQLIKKIKESHEKGLGGSTGWNYEWSKENAKKVLLRTHTTTLSARTLSKLKKEDLPAKFFSIGKVFRNETLDWSHGFEFNQSEGIVVDPNANFRHLIGYLKEFAKKMGYEKIRIQPAYFPYTEPSVEGAIWNEEKQEWVEVLAAGIFRPEVTIPLLGTATPVLAWGPGFDRLMLMAYGIKDIREIYKNDLKTLRNKKVWLK